MVEVLFWGGVFTFATGVVLFLGAACYDVDRQLKSIRATADAAYDKAFGGKVHFESDDCNAFGAVCDCDRDPKKLRCDGYALIEGTPRKVTVCDGGKCVCSEGKRYDLAYVEFITEKTYREVGGSNV